MNRFGRIVNFVVTCIVALLIVADWLLYVSFRRVVDKEDRNVAILLSPNVVAKPLDLDAYDVNGTARVTSRQVHGPWAIRFTAKNCPYTKSDQPRWRQLLSSMKDRGYEVFNMVPTVEDSYDVDSPELMGHPQLSFVRPVWGSRLALSKTPTILIFDRKNPWFGNIRSTDERRLGVCGKGAWPRAAGLGFMGMLYV